MHDVMHINVAVVGVWSLIGASLPLVEGFPLRGEWLRLELDAD
jgi:hypothetical protein